MRPLIWTTRDPALVRFVNLLVVGWLVVLLVVAWRALQQEWFEALVGGLGAVLGGIAILVLARLRDATVTIDATGLRRSRAFALPWEGIEQVGIGEGMLAPGMPYLAIRTVRRKKGDLTALGAAGSDYGRANAAAPLTPEVIEHVRAELGRRGLLRTPEGW